MEKKCLRFRGAKHTFDTSQSEKQMVFDWSCSLVPWIQFDRRLSRLLTHSVVVLLDSKERYIFVLLVLLLHHAFVLPQSCSKCLSKGYATSTPFLNKQTITNSIYLEILNCFSNLWESPAVFKLWNTHFLQLCCPKESSSWDWFI